MDENREEGKEVIRKMKKFHMCTLATFLFTSVLMLMSMARADTPKVGVKVGDWAEYSFDLWAGTSRVIETVKIEVTQVISTTIYYSVTWNPLPPLTDNAQLNLIFTNSGSVDFSTQVTSGSYLGYFIAINGSGSAIGGSSFSISRMELKQYLSKTFEVTHLTASGSDSTGNTSGLCEDLYWIKSNGVLVELEISMSGFSLVMKITAGTCLSQSIPVVCDINGDGKVNILDISIVARAFGSKRGEARYSPYADVDSNGVVNILDLSQVARAWKP